jgi:hypothetical protein
MHLQLAELKVYAFSHNDKILFTFSDTAGGWNNIFGPLELLLEIWKLLLENSKISCLMTYLQLAYRGMLI